MAFDDDEGCDRDDRTIFVANLSEKMTEKLLYELFFQAGPIERVAIPLEKDGKNKTFGFVTYKHLSSVNYALNIFAGTKLFGRELTLRNRNPKNRDQPQANNQSQPSMSLTHGYNNMTPYGLGNELTPSLITQQQQLLQQQLILMATGQNMQSYLNAGAQMFGSSSSSHEPFASTRNDNSGSHRDHFVDRHRHHRSDNRSNRSRPYRSRSRSPLQQQSHRNQGRSRDRSPADNRSRHHDKGRRDGGSNYHRWGKR